MGDNYVWTQKWSHMRVDACHLKRKSKGEKPFKHDETETWI